MTIRYRNLPAAVVLVFMLAACSGDPDTAAPSPAADAAMPGAEPASATLHEVTPADAAPASDIDSKALPGTFEGSLPCASCPGIDTKLQLQPDGSFVLSERYRDDAGTRFDLEGSWSVEGGRVRLDPNAKDEQDRLFQVLPSGELRLLDDEGLPMNGEPEHDLARTSNPQ